MTGEASNDRWRKLYALLNHGTIREQVIQGAAKRYGYPTSQVQLRLYVGRFAAPTKGTHEARVREWAAEQHVGSGPVEVYGLKQVIGAVREAASHKQYRDDPVLVTMKVLEAADMLKPNQAGYLASDAPLAPSS